MFKQILNRLYQVPVLRPIISDVHAQGHLYQDYMRVAWPATMQGLFMEVVTIVGLALVGALGANALAAIAIMSQPKMVMLIFGRALGVAITALVARRKGARDRARMNAVFHQGLLVAFLFYLPFLGLSYYFLEDILLVMGAQESFLAEGILYGQYITVSVLFLMFSQIVGSALIGVGNTKSIFFSNAVGNVVMALLSFVLIGGHLGMPAMGVSGAGLSALIGSIVTAVLIGSAVWRRDKELSLLAKGWFFSRETLSSMSKIGTSSFGEQTFERFGMVVYTMMVATLGAVPLATHHVCMILLNLSYSFAIGLGQATTSHIGQSLGQKRFDLADTFGRIGHRIGIFMAIIAIVIYVIGREPLLLLFTREGDVVSLGTTLILIMAFAVIPQTLQLVYSGVLKGAGDNFYVMKYSLFVIAIFRPIFTYFLCFTLGMGIYGAWVSLVCDQSLRMICAKYRVDQGKWKHIEI